MQKYKDSAVQMFLFGVVGITSMLIDIVITTFFYRVVSFTPFFASTMGYLSGFLYNFPLNRHKVFRHSDKDKFSLKAQLSMVFVLSFINLVVGSGIVHILVSQDILDISIAKALTTVLIALWNFLIFKFLIFSKNK